MYSQSQSVTTNVSANGSNTASFSMNNTASFMFTIHTSTCSTTIYFGARLNDMTVFTLRNYSYSAIYKVEELLQNSVIVLQ
ncbi:hypothetical protein [Bacteroides sp.]|uniref:hypothetical protein n=1 Tax=Bacteroides sp. TaxID=29523 RepID=UPI0025C71865|nr:hypothetical protein [Bacteroides sp.]